MTWQEVAQKAQKYREETFAQVKPPIPDVPSELPLNVTGIPKEVLTAEEIDITESLPEELLSRIHSGKLKSVDVANAFLRRAGVASKLTNCVTELLPERALERARFLDEYFVTHGIIGPLHGLPISVKEHLGMKGMRTNAGFCSWWDKIAEDDALLLKLLWKAGCIFYVRTAEPQTLMHLETSNNLYGVTVNPFNRNLTSGGSSGGEGALLGLRGSCMGVGSDIGGSIRGPAANNGVYGFRPSTSRLPTNGWIATMAGAELILGVVGPFSTSLEGIKLFMRSALGTKPWLVEPSLLPMPWKDDESYLGPPGQKSLKIGVLWDDGVVKPHPPIIRALREVVEKVKNVPGVEVVDWKPYKHDLAWDIISALYFPDGAQQESEAIDASGEPWRPLSNFIIKENKNCKNLTMPGSWKLAIQRDAYRAEYAAVWNQTASETGLDGEPAGMVDVIICPVGPGAAPPHDQARYWGYTSQWNLLDYPAVVFPVSQVDPAIDKVEEGYKPMNESDEFNYKLYEPEKYRDAPISLQLVGRRYDDEKVIEALEFIKDSIKLPFVDLTAGKKILN
ncbi:MAG: hypothetical protein M1834_003633 [Cirrosporium novae-zelandiae]|nr:MAG: hypothetical protein M1834_003633 [Cirrosporium novae-zelandiae]